MEELIKQLLEENLSCILLQKQKIYKETRHGILPILSFLEKGLLQDALLCDKVIGKAAAMMMVYGKVSQVSTLIISEHALAVFKHYEIPVTYKTCVPYIVNRKKDGMCPMEETVLNIDDLEEAYTVLKKKIKAMQANTHQ